MKKILFPSLIFISILNGCMTQPLESQSTSLNLNQTLNDKKFSQQGEFFLPTVSVFFPYGGILDVRAGSMPFYWLYKNPGDEPYGRDTSTMVYFETGERKIIKNPINRTKIKKISYGDFDPEAYSAFLQSLIEDDYVLDIEVKDNNQAGENGGQADQAVSKGSTQNKKFFATDNSPIPYLIFAYNKNDTSQFQIVSPSNLIDFKKNKNLNNIEFFLAAYPSIYMVMPGKDLATYYDQLNKKIVDTKLNDASDCKDFVRDPKNLNFHKSEPSYQSNCPTVKFWMVNYLITAKAVKYLNKYSIIDELSTGVDIPDNSLEAINDILWKNKNGKTVKVTYTKKKGSLLASSMQLNNRKAFIHDLVWDCDDASNCIPAGPSIKNDKGVTSHNDPAEDIPVYAILNFNLDQTSKMINGLPRFDINNSLLISEPK